ncbi:MAG: hypothetical protein KC609_10700 [Myxococcales bacterium]|nr:hypothetical protein [Myxococcales bacterium]
MHLKPKQKDWLARYLESLVDLGPPPCPLTFERSGTAEAWATRYGEAFVAHHGFEFAELRPSEITAAFDEHFRCDPDYRGFYELLAVYAQLCCGLADIFGRNAARARRVVEIGLLFAATFGLRERTVELADLLGESEANGLESAAPKPVGTELSEECRDALRGLASDLDELGEHYRDPLFAATLKASFRYADVRLLCELASDFYLKGRYDHLRMVELYLDRLDERRLLFQGAIAIAWADGEMAAEERRFLRRLIELANIPATMADDLERSIDEDDLSLPDLAGQIERPDTRRFFFRQLALISMADGVQEETELELLDEVGRRLELDQAERDRLSAEALGYYNENRGVFDHTVLGAFNRFRNRVAHRITSIAKGNSERIMTEVRQTKELYQLLGKASKEPLSADEKHRVREQLLDIAKTVPALAIFVIPGGSLVFAVLCKVLPFNLLPSAFADEG